MYVCIQVHISGEASESREGVGGGVEGREGDVMMTVFTFGVIPGFGLVWFD